MPIFPRFWGVMFTLTYKISFFLTGEFKRGGWALASFTLSNASPFFLLSAFWISYILAWLASLILRTSFSKARGWGYEWSRNGLVIRGVKVQHSWSSYSSRSCYVVNIETVDGGWFFYFTRCLHSWQSWLIVLPQALTETSSAETSSPASLLT